MIASALAQMEPVTGEGEVGVAVVGCGYWGVNYVRIFSELPETRISVICEERPERLSEIGVRYPGAFLSTDLDETLARPGVDAVVISTGAVNHFEAASRALRAGKHVLVEKPMTITIPEAERLVELADREKLTLMVGHTFLFNAGINKVRSYILEGKVGKFHYLYSRRTNLGPIRSDVNAIWDLAPHDVSIFNYLLDSVPLWVSAVGSKLLNDCREDVGFISLGYPDGLIANVHVSWAEPYKVREVVLVGSESRIHFNDLDHQQQVQVFEKGVKPKVSEPTTYGEFQFLIRDGDIISPRLEVNEPLKTMCSHFVDSMRSGKKPLTDGSCGLAVVRVMQAIDRSVAQNGVPVPVE